MTRSCTQGIESGPPSASDLARAKAMLAAVLGVGAASPSGSRPTIGRSGCGRWVAAGHDIFAITKGDTI